MSTHEVVTLEPADYATAGEVLGKAFLNDPLWTATITDPERLPQTLLDMFTSTIKTTVASEGVAETTQGMEAVAVWLPPGREINFLSILRSGLDMLRFGMSVPSQDRKRMNGVLRQLSRKKKELVPEPTWHLVAIGVDPAHQGKGFGSAMVRFGMMKADETGSPIYLETETEDNVRFYRHLGFEVLEEIEVEAVGVPMWLMKRPPAPRT